MFDLKIKQWVKNFRLIEIQYADTLLWWAKHKSCKCTEPRCNHFKELASGLFNVKVKESRKQLDALHLLRNDVVQAILDYESE